MRELSDGAYQMMMLWEAIGETEKIIAIDIHHFLSHHDHNVEVEEKDHDRSDSKYCKS